MRAGQAKWFDHKKPPRKQQQDIPQPSPAAIRICPKRDRPCPHGVTCPFTIDRYQCAEDTPND